jgi:adenylate cyclase
MSRPVIVCVDDESLVLDSLREQFRHQFEGRFRIELAQDSAEALDLLTELEAGGHEIPVLLSDHIMPGMKGDALLIEAHSRLPRTRKILLTGQAGVDAVGRLVNHGALYRYIPKPWARDDLALTIHEAVRSFYHELQVQQQDEELALAHAASRRFVPFEFLRLLGRERLHEISLHDHVEQRLSVMCSDIRSYTSLVEGKTPEQTFSFINEYLGYMEPPITAEGGFIDSFSGDGIMALFKGSPDHAVRAGIASFRALDRFNQALAARGEAPIRIGIGINTGPLMLGILGGKERLNASVIGDPVNLASRIEAYTKQANAPLLVSDTTVELLDDPAAYALRPVERVRLPGVVRPVLVHEVLDALPDAERARKLSSLEDLEAGRKAMLEGNLALALDRLQAARALDPLDPVIARALERCRAFLEHGLPAGWDGVTDLDRR